MSNENKKIGWFKENKELITILGTFLVAFFFLFNEMKDLGKDIRCIEKDVRSIEKDMAVIKTVMIMKDMMPKEVAKVE